MIVLKSEDWDMILGGIEAFIESESMWLDDNRAEVRKDAQITIDRLKHLYEKVRENKKIIREIEDRKTKDSQTASKEKYNNEPIPFFYYTLPELEEYIKKVGFDVVYSDFSEDIFKRKNTKWMHVYCKKSTS